MVLISILFALLATGAAFTYRYSFFASAQKFGAGYLMDRWTGKVFMCVPENQMSKENADANRLSVFRKNYPQYSDIEDRELVEAIQKKFYQDVELEELFSIVSKPMNSDVFQIKQFENPLVCGR